MGDILGGIMGGQGASSFPGGMGGGGGPLGMMGLDLSPHKVPFIGSMFQNPNEIHMKQQMNQAGAAYGQMRPEIQQAYMNSLSNVAAGFQPMNNALLSMYGPGAQSTNWGSPQGLTSPMGPSAMGVGQMIGVPQMAGGQQQGGDMLGGLGGMLGGLPGGDILGGVLGGGGGGGLGDILGGGGPLGSILGKGSPVGSILGAGQGGPGGLLGGLFGDK